MKLDKRIKDISTIQTIIRYDVNCIGCKGYFFDEFIQTKDLSKCRYGELIDITTHDDRNDLCFKAEYEEGLVGFYRFFIPEADLKPVEKKCRPYTLNEFQDQFHFGICIILRPKNDRSMEFHVTYNGYKVLTDRNIVELYLGPAIFTLSELFDEYERFENGRWLPFGVLVEEEE